MPATAVEKITVSAFLEMNDFEEGFFYELINGEIVKRSSPSTDHQRASRQLFKLIDAFVSDKKIGECFYAPFDVIFDDVNLAQPDILFVSAARASIVTNKCVEGAPDIVVEILSPGTFKTDRSEKMKLYRRFGIREYWILDPRNRAIEVYELKEGEYSLASFAIESGEVLSGVLEGLKVSLEQVY
jgi:Uma2 family endonuclease